MIQKQDIENLIAKEYGFTACDQFINNNSPPCKELAALTFCVLVLKNGYIVTGESFDTDYNEVDDADVGVSEENYEIAREKALNKIFALEAYVAMNKVI